MKPKYKIGDTVKFSIEDKEILGEIYIVDANGTWENPNEVSYDIMSFWNGEKTLFKHICESLIIE